MAKVTLYHKQLQRTIDVEEESIDVYKKSGWTEEVPKKYAAQEQDDDKEKSE